ncbi:thioredoxin [Candidatus Gottesmanbacteria bacterium RIFCSPLOWO2_02_FULL_42_29]|uniref:Thioredoxin n=2 Tax=Candidatus Gottesmaniibacteriota TaxID=1752720 RepID=A0A1F6BCQ5_9BACT|nr:MAG: Thioredoxin [Candidatus Gottesmanbacteria bacterium GW2011_GWA2_42_18]KKS76184.1 MAG: Thioredoxin [Candidatus Gottesmanbacteria bacterium GW2011_GWC2_42_8]OGG11108.1 MAG: thioredoxin [Candidatus Gottesmanbacteria bacterium RIFCSPHIGHO2_01_FULL_42_27]OGG20663.1 MAG: thioredoxin [Candidatus Gottesmanbacteria bacterium RIFCSPHIGHO2_12_FULL_43_26]OGG33929.1 MAG: thioredoxin [Candidatus Gottesmanbacteria bacterium RIFCSPLOWO2_12_FULL_42_10]OGG34532.1 MAG: thioredoxin [Candidatus Gottesmanba
MSEVTVTDSTFDDLVIKASSPVLVDFWAVWCGPCQIQNPILEELAREYEGKATIAKLNVDENPASAGKFSVMSIPTLILFKGGQPVKQWIGVQGKDTLAAEIKKVLH